MKKLQVYSNLGTSLLYLGITVNFNMISCYKQWLQCLKQLDKVVFTDDQFALQLVFNKIPAIYENDLFVMPHVWGVSLLNNGLKLGNKKGGGGGGRSDEMGKRRNEGLTGY